MAFTESTTNFGLPQWQPNDKPTFLVDMNTAYREIDAQMQANKNNSEAAIATANSSNTLANSALTASRENAQNIVTLSNSITKLQQEPEIVTGSDNKRSTCSLILNGDISILTSIHFSSTTLPTTASETPVFLKTIPLNKELDKKYEGEFIGKINYFGTGTSEETQSTIHMILMKYVLEGNNAKIYLNPYVKALYTSGTITY